MQQLIKSIETLSASIQMNLHLLVAIIVALWVIHMLNWLVHYRLNALGILPRTGRGFVGIPFAPLLHGDFAHLFFNSPPLLVLSAFILVGGPEHFLHVTIAVVALSGFGIWLFGRRGFHVGSSAVVMAYWAYLLTSAFNEPSTMTILLVAISLYYFGVTFFMSLLPGEKTTSWEGHVLGFLSGIATYFLLGYVLS